jgi:hypothetical protein
MKVGLEMLWKAYPRKGTRTNPNPMGSPPTGRIISYCRSKCRAKYGLGQRILAYAIKPIGPRRTMLRNSLSLGQLHTGSDAPSNAKAETRRQSRQTPRSAVVCPDDRWDLICLKLYRGEPSCFSVVEATNTHPLPFQASDGPYSRPCVRIPGQVVHRFQSKLSSCSEGSCPGIPTRCCPLFRVFGMGGQHAGIGGHDRSRNLSGQ